MKQFIHTVSLFTATVVLSLDAAVAAFLALTVKRIISGEKRATAVLFLLFLLLATYIAIKVTIDQWRAGVVFRKTECEFNMLDADNTFSYAQIIAVEAEKDERVSFLKNFLDRSSLLKITTADQRIHVINLSTLSRKKMNRIREQLLMRMEAETKNKQGKSSA